MVVILTQEKTLECLNEATRRAKARSSPN